MVLMFPIPFMNIPYSLIELTKTSPLAQQNPAWISIAIYIGIGLGILVFLIIIFGLLFQRKTTRDITPNLPTLSSDATQPYTAPPTALPLPKPEQPDLPSDTTQPFHVSDLPIKDIQETPIPPALEQTAHPPVPEDSLGTLTVLSSDDETIIGRQFFIQKSTTTLGRKPDNDIVFANDKPVSRYHARIEKQGQRLVILEIITSDEQGNSKCPTCGTFINDTQMDREPLSLKDGDIIQLGMRVRLRFNQGG
jgi:hypothetical protein